MYSSYSCLQRASQRRPLWFLALTGVHHYPLSLNLLPSRSCVCGYKMCLTAQTFCRQNCWNCTVCVRKQPGLFLQILPQLSPRDDRPSWNPWIRVFAISTWESSFSTFFFEVMKPSDLSELWPLRGHANFYVLISSLIDPTSFSFWACSFCVSPLCWWLTPSEGFR